MIDSFWNVDYVDALGIYQLKAINRMESEFLSLCQYNLFVSAELYGQYFFAIKHLNNPIVHQPSSPRTFNRFRGSSDIAE